MGKPPVSRYFELSRIIGIRTLLIGLRALVSHTAGNAAQERLVGANALDIEATAGGDAAGSAAPLSLSIVSSFGLFLG
jgi:hypothetical protein